MKTILRLRTPHERQIKIVLVDGRLWSDFDPKNETISLPASSAGKVKVNVE